MFRLWWPVLSRLVRSPTYGDFSVSRIVSKLFDPHPTGHLSASIQCDRQLLVHQDVGGAQAGQRAPGRLCVCPDLSARRIVNARVAAGPSH